MPPPPLKFSIVTPTLNHARFIGATVRSVLDQDHPDLEYLVMDGGSSDGTVDVLSQYDSRLRWISQPDAGQADAINNGFAKTTGEILAWLNSDDTYAPGAISAVARIFAADSRIGVVYGNAQFIDADGNPIAPCAHVEPFNRARLAKVSDFLVQPAVFFRRLVFQSVGGLDNSLRWAMDYDLWLKFAEQTRFEYLPRTLANYRWLPQSKTSIGGWPRLDEVRRVAQRHGRRGLPAYFRLEAIRLHLSDASHSIKSCNFATAATSVASATRELAASPRALATLFSKRTWNIIRTGQRLRHTCRPGNETIPTT